MTITPLLALEHTPHGSRWSFVSASDLAGVPLGSWPLHVKEDAGPRGRFVVAARAIPAGELIFEDEPIVHTVHDSCRDSICHWCYRTLSEIGKGHACEECGQVRACSAECAALLARVHVSECSVLSAIRAKGNAALLSGVRGLVLFVRLLHRIHAEPACVDELEALVEHYSDASAERRAFLDTMAAKVNRFVPPEVRMAAGRLARIISRVHSNLFALSDLAGSQLGSGLFARGSRFNHSCAPSAAASFAGRTMRLHALRALCPGEEVSIAYVELYAPRAERRAAVASRKGFECECARCVSPPVRSHADRIEPRPLCGRRRRLGEAGGRWRRLEDDGGGWRSPEAPC